MRFFVPTVGRASIGKLLFLIYLEVSLTRSIYKNCACRFLYYRPVVTRTRERRLAVGVQQLLACIFRVE